MTDPTASPATPALNGDVLAWLHQLPQAESELTFGEGRLAFTVTLRHVDKERLQQAFRAAQPNPAKDMDQEKLRAFLATEVLVDWSGLTAGIIAKMAAREAGPDAWTQEVPYSVATARGVLRACSGMLNGDAVSFESWLLKRATEIADTQAKEAAAAKNG